MAAPAPAADHTMEMMMMQQNQQMMMQQQAAAQERADRQAAQERQDRQAAQERADRAERQDRMAQQGGGGGGMMAPQQQQSTVVVMGGGNQPNVKYCGIVTHIISWFFPCICCCPIDEHRADEEVYIGIKTIICCLLLCARTPVPNKRVVLLVFADRGSLCAVTRGCSASRSTCGRGRRCSRRSSSPAAACRSSRS